VRRALALLCAPLLLAAAASPPPASSLGRGEKMARILQLEDRRSAGDGELDRYLSDGDRGVRRRAALAAGRIGDAALAPSLVTRMNDGEAEVRQMSAFALGLIGDAVAVERLAAALADADPIVRARSAEALGRLGGPRASAELVKFIRASLPADAPVLTVRGDDPGSNRDPWLALRLALFALVRMKDAAAAESVLLDGGRSRFDWWAATWSAMRLESPALKPVLAAAAASSDPLSRGLAARGLGALKGQDDSFDTVAALVKDKDAQVQVLAVRALGSLGDARGVPVVAPLLKSPSLALRTEALLSLAGMPPDPALRPQVVAMVGHEDEGVRGAALRALAKLDREEFALVLSGLDPDPAWSVRASRAMALADAGDEISQGILLAMLKDEDVRVLPAVLEGLRKARGADAVDTLRRHLEHADPVVRAAAAEGLGALAPPGIARPLLEAWKRSQADTELDARLAVVDALAALKAQDAAADADAALKQIAGEDGARVVRARASAALKARGLAPVWPGFEPPARPWLDYREAMAPYEPGLEVFTPRAILHTRRGRIEIHLDVVESPLTTASFMELAQRGFYDGLSFHRVIPAFVAQGGDPRGDGSGGPGYTLRCEIGQRPFGRGAVGMAHSGKDTGGSQFFIALSPQPHLDGSYTLFGWVVAGMEAADALRPGDLIDRVEIWSGR
jgi:cyclophilin family peptidyl-prolyl cis-trans isomerase/HEAT repeat protein